MLQEVFVIWEYMYPNMLVLHLIVHSISWKRLPVSLLKSNPLPNILIALTRNKFLFSLAILSSTFLGHEVVKSVLYVFEVRRSTYSVEVIDCVSLWERERERAKSVEIWIRAKTWTAWIFVESQFSLPRCHKQAEICPLDKASFERPNTRQAVS